MIIQQTISTNKYSRIAIAFFQCVLASIVIGLSNVCIPLSFSPVPISLQMHIALAMGLILGPKKAAFSGFLFLMQGAFGLPVFSFGGSLLRLFGPTGGYLVGYMVGAYVVGYIFEKSKRETINGFLSLLAGSLVVHLLGFIWLQQFVGMIKALVVGFLPFILGDILKSFLLVIPMNKVLKKRKH